MPPSATAVATENDDNRQAPPELERQGYDSESGNDDEEEEEEEESEYEEIEEEIEVEESCEEDDEEEEDGEEDLPGTSHGNDISSTVESNGNERKLGSGSFTAEKSEPVIPSEKLAVKDINVNSKSSSPPRMQKEDQSTEFEASKCPATAVSEKDVGASSHLRVGEVMDVATNSSNVSEKEVVSVKHCSGEVVNVIPHFVEEVGQMDVQPASTTTKPQSASDDRKRMASSCAAPDIGAEVQSSGVDFNKNKRPAIICDFFARGWCIKGSSCRFLHVKDNVDIADQKDEGVVSPENNRQQVHLLREDEAMPQKQDENQRLHSFQEDKFSFLQREHLSLGHSPDFKQYLSSRGETGSFPDARRESECQNLPAENYSKSSPFNNGSSPFFRSSTLFESRSSSNGPVVYSGSNCQSRNPSSSISSFEERLIQQGLQRLNSHLSLGSSHALASRFNNTFPVNGIPPSYGGSTWMGELPFPPPFSSEHGKFPPMNLAGDPLRFSDYKAKISSDDWVPSVPFRPSFFIIPSTSSSQGQYDPLRDSSDFPKTGDRDFKFSFSAPGTSAPNATYQQAYVDSTSTGVPIPKSNGDKSAELNRIQKDAKVERTSAADMESGKLVKEASTSDASHVNGNSKTNRVDMSSKNQNDGSGGKQDSRVEETAENNEKVVEQKLDDHVLKESKAAKLFRAALIDFVKELLKPTWLEGRLTKDAHNTIVKKAVDKIVSSFQSHQIPATMESAKQYLSQSEPKIMKLIKGYIERYGKS